MRQTLAPRGEEEARRRRFEEGAGRDEKLAVTPSQAALFQPPSNSDFAKVEKNLISLGFFTPASKRLRKAKAKTITFFRTVDGKREELSATIVPSAAYGLPVTADQDKYLAFQKLITDIKARDGVVQNPITFTSAELLMILGRCRDSGKNYQEVSDWLDLMTSTTLISHGVVYLAGRKKWARERFRVFDRAVSFGRELEPGRVADRNYVWVSDWLLDNYNQSYVIPVDIEGYLRLKSHIAKALAPLLQIWLYASQTDGCFSKRYKQLCEILDISEYGHASRINQQLAAALNELQLHGYLSGWNLERTADELQFKVTFYHGEKFHRDRLTRAGIPPLTVTGAKPSPSEELPVEEDGEAEESSVLVELLHRGIHRGQAQKLLSSLRPDQEVMDQLEWGDYLVAEAKLGRGQTFRNPPGFYVHLVSNNINPPETFVTSRRRRLHQEAREAQARVNAERERLHEAYYQYQKRAVRKHIEETYSPDEYEKLVLKEIADIAREDPARMEGWVSRTQRIYAESRVRSRIEQDLPLASFSEFCERQDQNLTLPFA